MQLSGTLLDLSQQSVNSQVSLGHCTGHFQSKKLLTPESSFRSLSTALQEKHAAENRPTTLIIDKQDLPCSWRQFMNK